MASDHQSEIAGLLRDIKHTLGCQLTLSVLRDRASVFWQMQSIDSGELRGMRALLDQYFSPELATTFQQLNDYELSRILAIQRVYEYLYYCYSQDAVLRESATTTGAPLPHRPAFEVWVQELCLLKEFTLIHERQGRYYPEFASEWLNPIIYRRALTQAKLLRKEFEFAEEAKRRSAIEVELEGIRQALNVVLTLASERVFHKRNKKDLDLENHLLEVFDGSIPEDQKIFCDSLVLEDATGKFWNYYFMNGERHA